MGDRVVIHGHRHGEPDRDERFLRFMVRVEHPLTSFGGKTMAMGPFSFPAPAPPSSTSSTPGPDPGATWYPKCRD